MATAFGKFKNGLPHKLRLLKRRFYLKKKGFLCGKRVLYVVQWPFRVQTQCTKVLHRQRKGKTSEEINSNNLIGNQERSNKIEVIREDFVVHSSVVLEEMTNECTEMLKAFKIFVLNLVLMQLISDVSSENQEKEFFILASSQTVSFISEFLSYFLVPPTKIEYSKFQ